MSANLLKEAKGFLTTSPEPAEEDSPTPIQSQSIGARLTDIANKFEISKAAESKSLLGANHDQSEGESFDESIETDVGREKEDVAENSLDVVGPLNASSRSDDHTVLDTASQKDDGDNNTLSCSYNDSCAQEGEEPEENKHTEKEQMPQVRRCSAFGDAPVVGPVTRRIRRRRKATKPRNIEAEDYNDLDSSSEFSYECDDNEHDPEADRSEALQLPVALAQGATKAVAGVVTEVNDSTQKMLESTTGAVRRSSSRLLLRVNSVSTALGAGVSQAFTKSFKFSPPTPASPDPVLGSSESDRMEEKGREIAEPKAQLLLQAKDKEIAELKAQLYEAQCKANSLIDANNNLSAQLEAYMLGDDGTGDGSDPDTLSPAAL